MRNWQQNYVQLSKILAIAFMLEVSDEFGYT